VIVVLTGLFVMPVVAVIGLLAGVPSVAVVAGVGWLLDMGLFQLGRRRGVQ
jgi:hypothetical protein